MRAFRWRSINVLVVVGYAVVGLPLVAAILLSTVYLERLTALSEATVTTGIEGTRDSQVLGEQLVAMERNARQYAVLGDPALLDLYQRRRDRFEFAARQLQRRFVDPALYADIERLLALSERMTVPAPMVLADAPPETFGELLELSQAIDQRIRQLTSERMTALEERSARIQAQLVWQASVVIALALLLAIVFTVLISRAVRQLAHAITRLGEGRFEREIRVRGPEDFVHLGGQLDWLRRRLQAVEEDKSAFLRNISHELKSPLANIREGSELLADGTAGALSETQREVAGILRENSLRLQTQIENLLNFNAWQNLRTPMRREAVRLDALARRVLDRYRLATQTRGLKVITELEPVTVTGDPEKLDVMLENLVSNAVKYSPPDGRLVLRVARQGNRARLMVADDGPGIEPAERQRVFRAFYQGRQPAPNTHVQGTGLGLSVVQECVRAHDGKVTIIDGETHGATFQVELPAG
ncbi:MAG TPA: ATP-binding protein [Gammaproteobacteria bacterium]